MDIGVHKDLDIEQEEYCFDVCFQEDSASVLINSCEQMITEKGSMVWMSPNMGMETKGGGVGKMFSKVISGESMFQNIYTANGDGMIAFGSSFPGKIMAVEVGRGISLIVQKSAFLASEKGVELSVHFNKKVFQKCLIL